MTNWPAVTQGRYLAGEEVLSVATHGFIGCYGHVRRTNMESLFWRDETEGMTPDTSLALPFSGLGLSHNSWLLWLWLDALLKNICTRGAPQKCFQSGPHLLSGSRKSASNRAPHLLRPALDGAVYDQFDKYSSTIYVFHFYSSNQILCSWR